MKLPSFPYKWFEAGSAIAIGLLASFVVGRATAPGHSIATDRIADVKSDTSVHTVAAETKKAEATKEVVRWKTQTVYLPGGTVTVTKTVVKEAETKATASTTTSSTAAVVHETVRTEVHEKIVTPPRPRWAVGANAGYGLDGKLRYGGQLERRIVGGLWVTAGVDVTSKAALIGLRWEF